MSRSAPRPPYPVAVAKVSQKRADALPVERRVGKFVARAETKEAFASFEEELQRQARAALTNPDRLLTIPHLRNSIAARMEDLEPATSDLIDGYILHWIGEGQLARLNTISRAMSAYQSIFWGTLGPVVSGAIATVLQALVEQQSLTLEEATRLLPNSLLFKLQHVEVLFGHLIYLGFASTDVAPGVPIESIRVPYASPRF